MLIKSLRPQIAMGLVLVIAGVEVVLAAGRAAPERPVAFKDVQSQTRQFIGYYHSIALSPEQKKLKEKALGSIPAPCCKEYPVLTCCCPCNFAKCVWGLSHYLIVKRNYDATQLRKAVLDWTKFTYSSGPHRLQSHYGAEKPQRPVGGFSAPGSITAMSTDSKQRCEYDSYGVL